MGEKGQSNILGQVRSLLLLGLAASGLAVALACAPAVSPTRTQGATEERPLSPIPDSSAVYGGDSVGEEAHGNYDEAQRLALRGKWVEAIAGYSQAITLDSSYWAAYEGRADAYHALSNHEEAIRDYDRAIEIRETSRLYMGRGHAFLELGKYPQADRDYHVALSVGPPSPDAYIGMGDAHREAGELEQAAGSYSDAITLDPDNWRAYYFRGVCYFQLRQLQQALDDFERVIILRPHNAGGYYARGAVRWLDGRCSDALSDFQAFLALSDDEEALSQAWVYIEHLEAMAQCEEPLDIPMLVQMPEQVLSPAWYIINTAERG